MTAPVALITGAADGIGWAAAKAFAGAGHRVVLADLRAEAAVARALELGPDHIGVGCDVGDEADVVRLLDRIGRACGRLDAVVNNAGVGSPHLPTVEQGADEFERVMRVHLTGAFLVSREAYKIMALRGGAIVNISSIAGLGGLPRRNAYGAAKAGIVAMTRSMACEWAASGVRVNAVAPGYVETALVRKLAVEGFLDENRLRRRIPLARLAKPEEIAAPILFLCSPAASYVTDAVLSVDGGWMAFADAGDASAETS
jgi:NAD(P)-dependent dehydrogenase (short-subunit alcohol dehydrogenase family)